MSAHSLNAVAKRALDITERPTGRSNDLYMSAHNVGLWVPSVVGEKLFEKGAQVLHEALGSYG
jgi:hypothetical protein